MANANRSFVSMVTALTQAIPIRQLEKGIVKSITDDEQRRGNATPEFGEREAQPMKRLAKATIIERAGFDDEGEQKQAAGDLSKSIHVEPDRIIYAARDAYDAAKKQGPAL